MKSLNELNILVVGDIMIDKYIEGDIKRISPEAPVPVVDVVNEYCALGGCGNVVMNLRNLGCNVDCLASIGIDSYGVTLETLMKDQNAHKLLFYGGNRTTVKERIIADHRKMQMLRIDREDRHEIDAKKAISHLENYQDQYDIIVISDYAKGMITYDLMEYLKTKQNADIIVDPKPVNVHMYNDVFMITPNEQEWNQMIMSSEYNLKDVKFVLKTMGEHGMFLQDKTTRQSHSIPAEEVEVYNVTGAGDTVIAVIAAAIASGRDVLTAAKIANKCAGWVITKPGTTPITKSIFLNNCWPDDDTDF
jgi:rfaE bifunctional protein kinase chain/domain